MTFCNTLGGIAVKFYKNNINIAYYDQVKQGFVIAMIDDAVSRLKDGYMEENAKDYTGEEYEGICNYGYSAENIDDKSMKSCLAIVDNFCYDYLSKEYLSIIREMNKKEKKGFGIDMYRALLYYTYIMDEQFREAAKKFPFVNAMVS